MSEQQHGDLKLLEKYYSTNQIEKGITKLSILLTKYPNSSALYYFKGLFHSAREEYNEAKIAFEKSIDMDPSDYNNIFNIGKFHLKVGNLKDSYLTFIQLLKLEPKSIDAYIYLGRILKKTGDTKNAERSFYQALKFMPNSIDTHYNLGILFQESGNKQKAIFHYQAVLRLNSSHESAQFMLSSLTGSTPNTAPLQYVENLFDNFAKDFEKSLLEELNYNFPELISALLPTIERGHSLGSVLDLGCGTGTVGLKIAPMCTSLVGVDISYNMLIKAGLKNVYDELVHNDIVNYLTIMNLDFDYIIAADVFIYVGNLSPVFSLVKSQSKKSGKIVFSTEHTDKDGFHLRNARYTHSKIYIEELCESFGFKMIHFSTTNLRKEGQKYLVGGIYILEF